MSQKVTVDGAEYEVDRWGICRLVPLNGERRRKVWRQRIDDDDVVARVRTALYTKYEEKAGRVAKIPLKKLRQQIVDEAYNDWRSDYNKPPEEYNRGYNVHMKTCYRLMIDETGVYTYSNYDLTTTTKVNLPYYWHVQLGALKHEEMCG